MNIKCSIGLVWNRSIFHLHISTKNPAYWVHTAPTYAVSFSPTNPANDSETHSSIFNIGYFLTNSPPVHKHGTLVHYAWSALSPQILHQDISHINYLISNCLNALSLLHVCFGWSKASWDPAPAFFIAAVSSQISKQQFSAETIKSITNVQRHKLCDKTDTVMMELNWNTTQFLVIDLSPLYGLNTMKGSDSALSFCAFSKCCNVEIDIVSQIWYKLFYSLILETKWKDTSSLLTLSSQ